MKLGIYAGSFNPIHNAHLEIANKVIENNFVDKVIFVPVGNGYNKIDLIDGGKRYEMIKLAIENEENMSVSDIEIVKNKLYSYETLNYFKSKYKEDEIYFIMGSDNLSEFHLWKEYKYILNNYHLIVLLRNKQTKEDFMAYKNIGNVNFVDYNFNLSSTDIRKNIKSKKYEEVINKLDKRVLDYIMEERLYE